MFTPRWLAVLCLCLASCARPLPPTDQPPDAVKTVPPALEKGPVIEVTPKDLFEAYAEDGGEGGKQYTNRVVKIEGVVKAVSSDEGKPCLLLYVPALDGTVFIRCAFDPARESDMADVKPGGGVTIRGRCLGPRNRFVTVDHCTVLRYRAPMN